MKKKIYCKCIFVTVYWPSSFCHELIKISWFVDQITVLNISLPWKWLYTHYVTIQLSVTEGFLADWLTVFAGLNIQQHQDNSTTETFLSFFAWCPCLSFSPLTSISYKQPTNNPSGQQCHHITAEEPLHLTPSPVLKSIRPPITFSSQQRVTQVLRVRCCSLLHFFNTRLVSLSDRGCHFQVVEEHCWTY